jgi:hypothetical protein
LSSFSHTRTLGEAPLTRLQDASRRTRYVLQKEEHYETYAADGSHRFASQRRLDGSASKVPNNKQDSERAEASRTSPQEWTPQARAATQKRNSALGNFPSHYLAYNRGSPSGVVSSTRRVRLDVANPASLTWKQRRAAKASFAVSRPAVRVLRQLRS